MTPQCLMCLSETSRCLIFSILWLGRLIKEKKNLRVNMNFHYQPLTLWCKCVYHISQGKCGGEEWKVLKHHLIPWVVEIVKSTQSNTSVSYSPWRATSKMGWVPETSSLILSFYLSLDSWERIGLFCKLQRWVMENFLPKSLTSLSDFKPMSECDFLIGSTTKLAFTF